MANGIKLADIKKELSGDEKVLESAFKLETLYKKHKYKLWTIIIALVVFFGGRVVMEKLNHDKLVSANNAFMTLQKDAKDVNAQNILKEKNPALFELFQYAEATKNKDIEILKMLANSENKVISDVSQYAVDTLSNVNSETLIYKDAALFSEAYLDIKNGKAKEAKNKLDLLDERSSYGTIAKYLKHAAIKAN